MVREALPGPPASPEEWLLGLLEAAVKVRASDLDITEAYPPTYHLDGEVVPLYPPDAPDPDWETPHLADALSGIVPNEILDRIREREVLDQDLSVTVRRLEARFRVNLHYQMGRLAAVFRLIPATPRSFNDLGMQRRVLHAATRNRGLFIVTGATGSGKSTTLAAIVEHINRTRPVKIVTIEDPVEYIYRPNKAYIVQREVGSDTESFSTALKSALRQAPDVILVGEMRDPETIALALTAAETGHLVLGTLHTHSAVGAVHRIVDAFPGDRQPMVRSVLSSTLLAVLAQELVPRKDGQGRVLIYELLEGTPGVRTLIREGALEKIPNQMQNEVGEHHVLQKDVIARLTEEGTLDPGVLARL